MEDDDPTLQLVIFVVDGAAGDKNPGAVIAAGISNVELGLIGRLAVNRTDQGKVFHGIRSHPIRQKYFVQPRPFLGRLVDATVAQHSLCGRVENDEPGLRVSDDDSVPHAVKYRSQIRVCSRSAASERASSCACCSSVWLSRRISSS